jgi:hypothetical protein
VKGAASLVLVLVLCWLASGCGGSSAPASVPVKRASVAAKREVAQRFAAAVFRGNAEAAVALLVRPHDDALSWLVRRAAAPWKASHAAVRLRGRRAGRWVFGFVGRRTHRDGRFEDLRGELAVTVGDSAGGAGVELFALRDSAIRYGTHHDSLLSPSRR